MDDQSLIPQAPALSWDEVPEPADALIDEKRVAETYYHDEVEKIVIEQIAQWQSISSVDVTKPADEFKIEAVANQRAASLLITLWEKVKDARRTVDTAERATGAK